jgi:hypothetical protein
MVFMQTESKVPKISKIINLEEKQGEGTEDSLEMQKKHRE